MNAPGWNLSLAGVTGILVILLSGTLMFLMDIIVLLMIGCVYLACTRFACGIPVEDSLDGSQCLYLRCPGGGGCPVWSLCRAESGDAPLLFVYGFSGARHDASWKEDRR
jgi:hypothetical protein